MSIQENTITIHCKCGYVGRPTLIQKPDPLNPEDSILFEIACPKCQTNDSMIEMASAPGDEEEYA